jgi:hypothetical protein
MIVSQDLEVEHYEIIDNTIVLWAITGQEFYCTTEQFKTILVLIKDDNIDNAVVGGLEILEKIEDSSVTLECDIRLTSKQGSNRIIIGNSIWDYELILPIENEVFGELLLHTN